MESTLAQWAQNEKDSIYVTKVNLSKHTELGKKFQISGTPSIIICKNGDEINRILGIVPLANLKTIYKKLNKE
ncbi:MAG: thioredoxin family protein [Tannerellaceae bacterium]|nr:thioredoxin family protein [Tannerellaceae bacterium]